MVTVKVQINIPLLIISTSTHTERLKAVSYVARKDMICLYIRKGRHTHTHTRATAEYSWCQERHEFWRTRVDQVLERSARFYKGKVKNKSLGKVRNLISTLRGYMRHTMSTLSYENIGFESVRSLRSWMKSRKVSVFLLTLSYPFILW